MSELLIALDNTFLALNRRGGMQFSFTLKEDMTKIDVFADLGNGQMQPLLKSALTRTLANQARCTAVMEACYSQAKQLRQEQGITGVAAPAMQEFSAKDFPPILEALKQEQQKPR